MPRTSVHSEITHGLNLQVLLGVLIAILGVLMLAYPLVAAAAAAATLGWLLLLAAVFQISFAFVASSAGSVGLRVLGGLLVGAAGFVLLVHPVAGAASLTLVLGSLLLFRGLSEIASAFQLRAASGCGWLLADGIVTLLLSGMILAGWPASTFWAIGTLFGISVLMSGVSRTFLAASAKTIATQV